MSPEILKLLAEARERSWPHFSAPLQDVSRLNPYVLLTESVELLELMKARKISFINTSGNYLFYW